MERAQAAAVGRAAARTRRHKPAFLTKFTRPVLAKDPEGYKQGYEPGTSPCRDGGPATTPALPAR